MAYIQVCRVCLSHDVPMCSISNTKLQHFYERNTKKPFNTKDGRLSMVCYICCHLLKKCQRFFECAIKADEVLQEMYDSKTQITEKSFTKMDERFLFAKLKQSPVEHTTIEVFRMYDIEIHLEEYKEHPDVKREPEEIGGTDQEFDAMDDFCERPRQDDIGTTKEIEIDIKGTEEEHINNELESKKEEVSTEKPEQKGDPKQFREVILSKEEQIQQMLERTKTLNYKYVLYKCHLCYRGFVDDEAFGAHMKRHDESTGEFECDVCRIRYPTAKQLQQHASLYHKKYVCTMCEHTSRTIAQAKQHYKWQHGPSNETKEIGKSSREFFEILLSKQEQIQHYLEMTKTKYKHMPVKCRVCFVGFADETSLKCHEKKHDKSAGAFECDVCHNRYPTARQLQQHANVFHKKFVCTKCEHWSPTVVLAKKHFKWQHQTPNEPEGIEPELICNHCGNKFKKLTLLMQHLKIHENVLPQVFDDVPVQNMKREPFYFLVKAADNIREQEFELKGDPAPTNDQQITTKRWSRKINYVCNYCGMNISDITDLQTHIKTLHKYEKQISIIEHNTNIKTNVTTHLKILHDKVSQPQKPEANTKKLTGSSIKKQEKRYVCSRCGKIVANKNDLTIHLKKHMYKKTYVCDYCGKSCKNKPVLKEHVRIHTGEKPYECDYCNKRFPQKCTLVKHFRMHTGEKPYTCDYCGVKISQLSNLRMHLKRHTGEKPFKCSYCEKCFARKNHLTEHLRLHTGETPFQCVYCDKKFRRKRVWSKHVKMHSCETRNTNEHGEASEVKGTDYVAHACLQ